MSDDQRRDEPTEGVYPDATAPSEPGAFDATRPMPQTPPPLPLTPPGAPQAQQSWDQHGSSAQRPWGQQQPPGQPQQGPWGQQPQQGYPQWQSTPEGQQQWGQPGAGAPPGQGQQHWGQQPSGQSPPGQPQQGQWGQPSQGSWPQQAPGAYGASTQPGPWGQPGPAGQPGQPGYPQGAWGGPGQPGHPGQPGQPGQAAPWGAPATTTRKPMNKTLLGILVAALAGALLIGLLIYGLIGRQEATAACTNTQCELTLVHKGATVNLATAKGDRVITQQGIDGDTAKYSVDGTERSCRRGESARVGDLTFTCSTIDADKLVLTVKN